MTGGAPGGYGVPPMMPPMPVQKPNKNGCLLWGLIGCGALVLLLILVGGIAAYQISKNPEVGKAIGSAVNGVKSTENCQKSVLNVREAINAYQRDHGGHYPPSLSALIPKYLTDQNALDCRADGEGEARPMEYTPPPANAPADTVVVSVRSAEIDILNVQQQILTIRLLKDKRIVQDQEVRQRTRTLLYPAQSGSDRTRSGASTE